MRCLITTCTCLLALSSCGGTTWVNKKYRGRLSGGSQAVLLMPVEVHRFPASMRADIEKMVNGEVTAAFRGAAVSLQPLHSRLEPAGFGNLDWKVALGAYHRGRLKESADIRGTYYDWQDDLPAESKRFLKWVQGALAEAGIGGGANVSRRYLLSFYVDRIKTVEDKKKGPRLVFRVVGGLYDAERSRIVAATGWRVECKPTWKAVRAKLTGVGNRLRRAMAPVLP